MEDLAVLSILVVMSTLAGMAAWWEGSNPFAAALFAFVLTALILGAGADPRAD